MKPKVNRRSLLFIGAMSGVQAGACGSRTLLGETQGEVSTGTGGDNAAAVSCTGDRPWSASGLTFRLQVFNKPGADPKTICGPPTSDFSYVLATNVVTDRSCYVTEVGTGSFTVDASTADAIVAQLEALCLVDQNMCKADTPTYAFGISLDSGRSRIFQDCAPHSIAVPPFINVDGLAHLDRLLTDAAQRARYDAGR